VAAAVLLDSPPLLGQALDAPAFSVYGMPEGLSQGSVEALIQDSVGFLWIGTHDGLNRFDGTGFRTYKHSRDDQSTLSDDFILDLLEADSGRLWVGTERGGLNLFDPFEGTARRFDLAELGPWMRDAGPGQDRAGAGRTVSQISRLSDGSLVLLTDLGLVEFDPTSGEAVRAAPPNAGAVTATCSLREGVLVGFADGSILLRQPEGWRSVATAPRSVRKLRCRPSELVHVIGSSGFVHGLDVGTGRLSPILELTNGAVQPTEIEDVLELPGGAKWVATLAGAYVADTIDGLRPVASMGSGRALPDPWVTRLLLDRTGVLWVGTWNGLASLSPNAAAMTRVPNRGDGPEGLGGTGVVSIESSTAGGLWVGTIGGGVQHLDVDAGGRPVRLSVPQVLRPLAGSVIFGLDLDDSGNLWIAAHAEGVYRLTSSGELESVPVLSPSGQPLRATPNSVHRGAGRIWVGTEELGLLELDASGEHFAPRSGPEWNFGSLYVWPIASGPDGSLWVGAYNGGVARVDPEQGVLVRYGVGAAGLSDARILTLFVDSRGLVWVGTEGGGLNRIDPSTDEVRVLTVADGLPHDHVEGIVEDDEGYLWISTNDGIARLHVETETFRVFGRASGLAGNRFLANGVHKGPGGWLYFGGEDGLTMLDPSRVADGSAAPPVALTGFRIQGREAPLSRALSLSGLDLGYDERFFAFDFAALDYTDPGQNRYRYRLDPLDEDWIDAGADPTANYTSVPPNEYVFRVSARNSAGVWNETGIRLPIRVQAPYYATWWFRTVAGVFVLSVIAGFYNHRISQIRERQERLRQRQEQEREHLRQRRADRVALSGRLHDDLGADLVGLAMRVERLRRRATAGSPDYALLKSIEDDAKKVSATLREELWVVNVTNDPLPKLVSRMRDTAQKMLSGLEYSFVTDPIEVPAVDLDWELRLHVFLLFKESLNNAVRHAQASRVEIALAWSERELLLRVQDNGRGFDPATIVSGNGLGLMRERANNLRGSVTITASVGRGTLVELRVPLG